MYEPTDAAPSEGAAENRPPAYDGRDGARGTKGDTGVQYISGLTKDALQEAIRLALANGVRQEDIRIEANGLVWAWSPLGFWDVIEEGD